MRDVHWFVTVDYQQIGNGNIANQIHGFTIDYGKFILIVYSFYISKKTSLILIADSFLNNEIVML